MADIEKVIRDLRYLRTFGIASNNLQVTGIARSAIALLKEQESIIESLKSDLHETLEVVSKQKNVVRCKECKHRPKEPNLETYENGFDIEFPEYSKCPCQCSSDRYYSWYPDDDWFCAEGERRTD